MQPIRVVPRSGGKNLLRMPQPASDEEEDSSSEEEEEEAPPVQQYRPMNRGGGKSLARMQPPPNEDDDDDSSEEEEEEHPFDRYNDRVEKACFRGEVSSCGHHLQLLLKRKNNPSQRVSWEENPCGCLNRKTTTMKRRRTLPW